MPTLKFAILAFSVALLFTGCDTQPDDPLPTLVDLEATNAVQIAEASTASAIETATAQAPTATSMRPTLPPTFTPTVEQPSIETTVPTLDPDLSPTPEGFREDGTIYYNYNGDSIARVYPDGTGNEIVITFGVDQRISDVTASPDGRLLAFVAPSAGSGREVWVATRDGSYLQKVSCLGFGEVREPTFAPDSNRIAFFAAPLATTNMSLYVADFIGSNDCPTGNNQQALFDVATTETGDIAWNASADMIYYNAGGTYVYDFGTQASYEISSETGFGTDVGATYNLSTNQFVYLRTTRDLTTGVQGGSIIVIDDADTFKAEYDINPIRVSARHIEWGADDASLLYATADEIYIYELDTTTRFTLLSELVNPMIAYAPDQQNFIYTSVDPETQVTQIYRANQIDRRERSQLTFNPEGTIQDIMWLEG